MVGAELGFEEHEETVETVGGGEVGVGVAGGKGGVGVGVFGGRAWMSDVVSMGGKKRRGRGRGREERKENIRFTAAGLLSIPSNTAITESAMPSLSILPSHSSSTSPLAR